MDAATSKSLKILIIEDDQGSRVILQKQLSRSSLPISAIKTADTLNSACEILDKSNFDAILLDLNLPDSTDLDTLAAITKKYFKAAVIVITGDETEDLGLKTVAIGAQEYLKKDNCTPETLDKTIRYAIERKRTQEILDTKQRNLEAIFDAAPVGMLLVDENLIVKRVNSAIKKLVNKEYSQIIKREICSVLGFANNLCNQREWSFSPVCRECWMRNAIVGVLDSGQPVQRFEVRPTLKVNAEESTPWLSISIEHVIIDGSKHVLIAIEDITERKEAEQKLKETMELKSQFVSSVSHELRTPLTSIKEAVEIVLYQIVGNINNKQRKFLDIAKRNLDRLARLINDILDFQKLESNKVQMNIQLNDISIITKEVYRAMIPVAKKNAIELCLEPWDHLPKAKFDRDKIIQVLTNLLHNAIKYTPEQGKVSVLVRYENQNLVVSVSDTGIGIPKDQLPKIFDGFYRVHGPDKQIQGTGLGLAIVKKIVMAHGGRIEVESEVDQGSTFTVFLPLEGEPLPEALPQEKDEFLENNLAQASPACTRDTA